MANKKIKGINGTIPNFILWKKIIQVRREMIFGTGLRAACQKSNITTKQFHKAMQIVNRRNSNED